MIKLILPEEIYPDLFKDAALSKVLSDGKALADAIPKFTPEVINKSYSDLKDDEEFKLLDFLHSNFTIKKDNDSSFQSNINLSTESHIHSLWDHLSRKADPEIEGDSLIPLPFPYVVPGGRFNEIYYWDSYFTMLGLKVSGKIEMIESMVDNFSYLIENAGFIPNGNRSYFLSRSQPPFYVLMIEILAEIKGDEVYHKYLPFLQKEYDFWMANQERLSESNPISSHTVLIKGKYVMNRYNDKLNSPRSEMYVDDVHLAGYSERNQDSLFSHLRAACESGWDFSSRWCSDPMDLKTIHTGDIVPVDLNCLIYRMESTLSHCYDLAGDDMRANKYLKLSERRQKVIEKLFWDKEEEFYFDFDISKNSITNVASLAGIFPLFFEISDVERAENCLSYLEKHFLKKGGLVTTNINSGQQWDAPNGWAPLQWVGFIAAINYQNKVLADCISHRWTQLNDKVFKKTGKMMEKYNVEDPMLESGGGEYPVQDGFGWSNGVYLAMKAMQY